MINAVKLYKARKGDMMLGRWRMQFIGWLRNTTQRRWHLSNNLKEGREQARQKSGGTVLQVEGAASAKALRRECAWCAMLGDKITHLLGLRVCVCVCMCACVCVWRILLSDTRHQRADSSSGCWQCFCSTHRDIYLVSSICGLRHCFIFLWVKHL